MSDPLEGWTPGEAFRDRQREVVRETEANPPAPDRPGWAEEEAARLTQDGSPDA